MPDRVILIAAVTVDGYIARHNLEITNWSQDLKLFKDQTMGCPVIWVPIPSRPWPTS